MTTMAKLEDAFKRAYKIKTKQINPELCLENLTAKDLKTDYPAALKDMAEILMFGCWGFSRYTMAAVLHNLAEMIERGEDTK